MANRSEVGDGNGRAAGLDGPRPVADALAAQPDADAARAAEARRPAMKKITIDHVSRIEGHATISIMLDDTGQVTDTQFHVTQIRGFEKFTEGRPYYEMPSITSRICGICPVSHLLASSKACDDIMAVRIPETAAKLRELLHCAQFVQSHALSFFYLSAPDLLLGMDSDPAKRNVAGLLAEHPDALRDGIALRKFGQQLIERLARERVHPSWTVPGGVNAPLDPRAREKTLAELPAALAIVKRTISLWKKTLDGFPNEIESFSNSPTMYCGLVGPDGSLRLYDGNLRFIGPDGAIVADQVKPNDYATYIGEATLSDSYLKAPYYRPVGYPDGVYRVGPLARLNVADRCGTPEADKELAEYRERLGRIVQSGFHYHYARLIEALYALERMQELLDDPAILGTKVRAHAGVNNLQGIGIIEAPRGTLIHHYKVDDNGAMTWANLIVATGHNNLAIGRGILQVAKRFVDGEKIQEGALNRIESVIRCYDPCLSCSTHALGQMALQVQLLGPDGTVMDELAR
jgi:NAD-reducing hydrogenase large subunit